MNFFKRNIEADNLRKILGSNGLPIDEKSICSDFSKGKVERFDKLRKEEFECVKLLSQKFTHSQLVEGLYKTAIELSLLTGEDASEEEEVKIIEFLKASQQINHNNEFKLNEKGEVLRLDTPLKRQSYYSVYIIAILLAQAYLKRLETSV